VATLSRKDVEHVAYLARLGLSEEELTRLEGQLNHIVDQYAIFADLDTDHIPPTAQTIEVENILREDVARPGLTTDELARLEGQLNHIVDQYAIFAQLDTDDIAPTAQTIELENILREDVVTPSLPRDAVLANAADRDADYIAVPAILGES